MLTRQHLRRAAKFRCHSAEDRAEFRCRLIVKIATKDLISPGVSISEGCFSAAVTGFSPAGRGICDKGLATRLGTPPLANLAALTLAGGVHKLRANRQGRKP